MTKRKAWMTGLMCAMSVVVGAFAVAGSGNGRNRAPGLVGLYADGAAKRTQPIRLRVKEWRS